MGDPQKRYPPELKERAVRMVLEARAADPDDRDAIRASPGSSVSGRSYCATG